MKKLWVSLLAMLMTCALLLGAWAEAVVEDAGVYGEELYAEPVEEEVTEVEEFAIGEEEALGEAETNIEGFDSEEDSETAIAAPAMAVDSASTDFEIKDGVLVKYRGDGWNVVIPDGVTKIGDSAFYSCTALTGLTIPDSVTSIGEGAIWGCINLASITIPGSVESIGEGAFVNCTGLTSVDICDGVKHIGRYAFEACSNLTSIKIPGSVTAIDEGAFQKCSKLDNVTIPDSVTSIENYLFYTCSSLSNVKLPDTITSIGTGVFVECTSLTSLTIPASVKSIGPFTFRDCINLKSLYVESAETKLLTAREFYGDDTREDNEDVFYGVTSKLTIYCKPGSYAEAYAKKWGIKYEIIHTHTPEVIKGYPATTTEEGLTDGEKCSVCGAILVEQVVIPKLEYGTKELMKLNGNGTVTLNYGEGLQLLPAFATSAGLTVKGYKSSKTKVAAVDGSGIVTAKAEGKATITVTTNNKKKKATVVIKVIDPYKPTGVSITNGKKVTLEMGKTLKLGTKLKPDTAQSNLTWKSSKKSVASVDGNGLVTPHKEGTAKITVTTRNKKKATITVKVIDPFKPTGISITGGKTLTIKAGETLKLGTQLKPDTAQSELTWKSSNKKIATVDATGTVKALKKGKVKITVTSKKNKKVKATITVKVEP